ncbi:metallophosphoesterase family protein [Paracoccus laeviglucosivorans]|uniref:Calcineurin-like phosphoesterase n=1 Tax=Paracoccus laeviglucosivorans TaxID=1197861 RepID=A0A521D3K4_9RHOB|nr:metallophosphoesterase [Paracoccus laeviglucosivorans]SMO66254.1 Calcineurin-like phosphoesterase [Paracoccus laeviglucosivorans]
MDMTMAARIMVVADLHLDHWKHAGRNPLDALTMPEWAMLDGLIVAGDLSNEALRKWPRFLSALTDRVAPGRIHIVPGNHDYYGLSLDRDDALADICAAHGVGFAQERTVTIAGQRFLCATLWTDIAQDLGRDADRIAGASPRTITAMHRRHVGWLDHALAESGPDATVVTHHAPHPDLLPPDQPMPDLFASDLGALIRRHRPRQWLFGHAHRAHSAVIEGCYCRNVAFGPPAHRPDPGARLRQLII